ncbi:MAG: hypothetical protein AAF198_09495 [Pseudomonadota bacterium]
MKFFKQFSAGVIGLLSITSPVLSQNCDSLLSHGITNVRIAKSSAGAIATKFFNHCHKDFSAETNETLASISVEVLGYGSGDGSFSRSQSQRDLTEWCKTNKSFAESNSELYEESRTIYGQAVTAWDNCNKLAARGVKVDVRILPNNKVIDIGLRREGAGGNVEYLGTSVDNFTCTERTPTGNTATEQSPILITGDTINISCVRAAEALVTRGTGDYQVLEWGRVTVHTAEGPFQFYFEQEETPTLPTAAAAKLKSELSQTNAELEALKLSFSDTVVAFASNTCPIGWREYPQAYGRVVRGIDRSGANIDSEGERQPGSTQEDALQAHSHSARYHNSNTTGSRPHPNMEFPQDQGNKAIKTGGPLEARVNSLETRVKNVALLYCIRE